MIDEIVVDDNLNITEEAKKVCKERYLAIAALAKREYRSDPSVYKRKRVPKKTPVFQKLREFEENKQIEFIDNLEYQWDKDAIKTLQDKYNRLKRNFDAISQATPGEPLCMDNYALLNQLDRIDKTNKLGKECIKGTRVSTGTQKEYRRKLEAFMRVYNPGKNLLHLIIDPKQYVTDKYDADPTLIWRNNDMMINGIKFYLRCSGLLDEFKQQKFNRASILAAIGILEDYSKPKRKEDNIQQNQKRQKAKKDPYPFLIQHFGMFFTWGRFRCEVNRILRDDLEENYTQRLIMSLYTDYIPRRSSDYVNMIVIDKDVNPDTLPEKTNDITMTPFNYLIFTKKTKRFIFNYWKNAKKKGKQEFDIEDNNIIHSIENHLKNPMYKATNDKVTINGEEYKYLLYTMRDGKPLKKSADMVQQLQNIRNKWDIPFTISDIRHLFATWFIRKVKKNREQVRVIAWQMGTSENMLMNIYYDADVVQQLNMDSLDEFSDNDLKRELDMMYDKDMQYFRKYHNHISKDSEFLKDMDGEMISMNYKGTEDIPSPPTFAAIESQVERYFGRRTEPCKNLKGCPSVKQKSSGESKKK